MLGVTVNTLAVILGSLLVLLFRKGIPEKYTAAAMTGNGLCTLYIGMAGALKGQNPIVAILSVVTGAVLGTWLGIDRAITALGQGIQDRFRSRAKPGSIPPAEGFVTASLLFCAGAMTVVGSLNAGLSGDNEMLFTKSMLDFIASIMLSVSLGIGVLFSAAFVFVFQGSIVLAAGFIGPLLSPAAVAEMGCAGSILILAIGLNLLGITRIRVADFLPAIALAPLFAALASLFF